MTPHEVLSVALADLAARDRQTPCQADPEPWTSDDYRDRRDAATRCQRCPVIQECGTAGHDEDYFVWAGVDRSRPTRTGRVA